MSAHLVYLLNNESGQSCAGTSKYTIDAILHQHLSGKHPLTKHWLDKILTIQHSWCVRDNNTASAFRKYLMDQTPESVQDLILDCPLWCQYLENEVKPLPLAVKAAWRGKRIIFKKPDPLWQIN